MNTITNNIDIDKHNEIIIHRFNINIPIRGKHNLFKYLATIICKTVGINKSCRLMFPVNQI